MHRYLSKSRFKLAVDCPTKLYYTGKKEYADTRNTDAFMQMLAKGGFQVGALAKLMFPGGIEINERTHDRAEAETAALLQRDAVVLFEPAIRCRDFFIRVDVLVKDGSNFDLIEVKSKSYDSKQPKMEGAKGQITSAMREYVEDVAFQTYVMRHALPDAVVTPFLMMPDKAKTALVDGVNQMFKIVGDSTVTLQLPAGTDGATLAEQLLTKVDVSKYVRMVLEAPLDTPAGEMSFDLAIQRWAEAYREDRKITPVFHNHCAVCEFRAEVGSKYKSGFHECVREATTLTDVDLEAGTVLDLWNFRSKDKLIEEGILKLSDVRDEHLKNPGLQLHDGPLANPQRQWLQVNGVPTHFDRGGFFFNARLVRAAMETWTYPYHFIDFETSTVALPFFAGMHPYQQVAFQFSHHVMERGGAVRHVGQFLCAEPGRFPNYEFARALRDQLNGDEGSVFMWHHHEATILKAILKQIASGHDLPADFRDLRDFATSLVEDGSSRKMVDLKELALQAFFHPMTHGSNSIKQVLPATLASSPELRARYTAPIYGGSEGIPSLNFKEGFAWLDASGDPYTLLKDLAKSLLPPGAQEDDPAVVAEGGAAAVAYSRLQFEDLDSATRHLVEGALYRYCELDTFAMVMIVEAWREWAERFTS